MQICKLESNLEIESPMTPEQFLEFARVLPEPLLLVSGEAEEAIWEANQELGVRVEERKTALQETLTVPAEGAEFVIKIPINSIS